MYFYLKNTKSNNSTLIFLKYNISKKGKFVYSTGQKINPLDWNFNEKFTQSKRGRTDIAIISKELNKYSKHLDLVINNLKFNDISITKEILKDKFDSVFKTLPGKKNTVFQYLELMVQEKSSFSKETIKKYNNVKLNLLEYQEWKKVKLTFDSFRDFKDYATFCYQTRQINDNTINKHYSYIKTFVIWAYKKGLHDIRDYSDFKHRTYEPDNIALTKDHVLEIYNHKFKNERLQKVIDVFLIGCFTGQRFSDFSVFDKDDYINGRIEKRQQKTKHKVVIPVDSNKKLKTLLFKYDFNLPKISNQKFNPYLREALEEIKSFDHNVKKTSYNIGKATVSVLKLYEMVSSHTARRTFVTITLEEGWTYKEVMRISGITDYRTLLKYDKVSNERLDKKVKDTWC